MKQTQADYLPIDKLRPFEGHPFQIRDDEEMDQLVWSVLTQGILTPIVVRPLDTGQYEVISGHRRVHACQKAGITQIPALIYTLDRDAAAIALVDSNLHRERILPSEKAFAYKLKMDALNHQGQTCGQVGHKSRDTISETESGRQIQRYIRLTNLIPEILHMVDEGRIALTPAVELSYLTEQEQQELLETMESDGVQSSLSQSQQLKKLSQQGELNVDRIFDLLSQQKPNQEDKIGFLVKDIRKYFPKNYTTVRIQETILQLLQNYERSWKRRNRDER